MKIVWGIGLGVKKFLQIAFRLRLLIYFMTAIDAVSTLVGVKSGPENKQNYAPTNSGRLVNKHTQSQLAKLLLFHFQFQNLSLHFTTITITLIENRKESSFSSVNL